MWGSDRATWSTLRLAPIVSKRVTSAAVTNRLWISNEDLGDAEGVFLSVDMEASEEFVYPFASWSTTPVRPSLGTEHLVTVEKLVIGLTIGIACSTNANILQQTEQIVIKLTLPLL